MIPVTALEDEQLDWGDDVCVHVVRLYDDLHTKKSVEAYHDATNWRARELGWDL